jgi:hypothetical protein
MRKLSNPGIFCLTAAACLWQLYCGWNVHRTFNFYSSSSPLGGDGEVAFGWLPENHIHEHVPMLNSTNANPNIASTLPKALRSASALSDRREVDTPGQASLAGQAGRQAGQEQQQQESFSACLLTKDDNHWLIEWLAYHYHVLPLRQLILVRDPTSRTSPDHILNRWKRRMNITVWTDRDILPKWVLHKFEAGNITNGRVGLHRYRQQFFYAKCLREFQNRNQTWVLLSDVDEFVRPNPYSTSSFASSGLATDSSIPLTGTNGVDVNDVAPTLARPGSVLHTLQNRERQERKGNPHLQQRPEPKCLHVPRIQMTTKEVPEGDAAPLVPLSQSVPLSVSPQRTNTSHLLTTRWLYHNGQEIRAPKNLNGKNIVHVGRLLATEIPNKVDNVHTVIADPTICPASSSEDRLHHPDSWLLIQHYAGTFEQYSYRDDPRNAMAGRRSQSRTDRSVWERIGQQGQSQSGPAARTGAGTKSDVHDVLIRDNAMLDWLPGFVKSVGASEAARLLYGVGVVGIA